MKFTYIQANISMNGWSYFRLVPPWLAQS